MRTSINRKTTLKFVALCSFLIFFSGLSVPKLRFRPDMMNLEGPKTGQVPELEFSQSTFTNFTVFQGQEFQVNWTITGGNGKSYRVTQIGEQGTIMINFGFINKDDFYIYGPINSSQLGTYTVQLEVFNATYSITREFTLFVKLNMDLIIPQVILMVAGSVAVAVGVTSVYFKRRNRQTPKTRRNFDEKIFKEKTRLDSNLTPEDQTFISTTDIDLVAIASFPPQERFVVKKFQQLDPEGDWHAEIFKKIANTSAWIPCKNTYMKIKENIRYLTCMKYGSRDQAIVVVSKENLNDNFLSILLSSIKMLAGRDPNLIDNPGEFLDELTRILCLDRSFNYQFSRTIIIDRMQRSRFWTSRRAPEDEIRPQEMKQIEEDLEGMTQNNADDTVTFFDRIEKEFDTEP